MYSVKVITQIIDIFTKCKRINEAFLNFDFLEDAKKFIDNKIKETIISESKRFENKETEYIERLSFTIKTNDNIKNNRFTIFYAMTSNKMAFHYNFIVYDLVFDNNNILTENEIKNLFLVENGVLIKVSSYDEVLEVNLFGG